MEDKSRAPILAASDETPPYCGDVLHPDFMDHLDVLYAKDTSAPLIVEVTVYVVRDKDAGITYFSESESSSAKINLNKGLN